MSIRKQALHTGWQFRPADERKSHPAEVPGCVHTDLFRNGLIPDPFHGRNELRLQWIEEKDWEYRLVFEADDALFEEENVELVADGLDTLATIALNGETVAKTESMFVGYRFDVKPLLRRGRNVLTILFHNPMDYLRAREKGPLVPVPNDPVGSRYQIRKQQCAFGWDWGPRFATSGIWRPIALEAWSGNRLSGFKVTQRHEAGTVTVGVEGETVWRRRSDSLRATLTFEGAAVAEASGRLDEGLELPVRRPQLWWTNGLGGQPLYDLTVELLRGDTVLDTRTQRIGLCELRLDRHSDEWGESFQFLVNGRPVFAKGANWIPAHSFVNEGRKHFDDLLDSAVAANMNMLRVWGGGIYEFDEFYEGCLRRGLLVWQDFMFACCLYPADPPFVRLVKAEAEHQVRRLRNFSNLALWCGNNEIVQMGRGRMRGSARLRRGYERVFHGILPAAVAKLSPEIAYWPTSEHNPHDWLGDTGNDDSGDAHYWGVWHSREPVENYEKQRHRFFSEFGMQAYPCAETAATFTDSTNIFGPDMDNHQKNGGGNQIILHYVASLYRFPKDYPSTVYLSQLNQAFCLRFGIEHMRRNMPRTMGALYWQLNDCWPVASWSSIDHGGRWKALHYAARRFFAPALVSVKRLGEENLVVSNNFLFSSINALEIHTVCDGPRRSRARLRWELWSVGENRVVTKGERSVPLRPGEAKLQTTVDASREIARFGREDLILRTHLESDAYPVSRNTTFLAQPKRVEFQRSVVEPEVMRVDDRTFEVRLSSDTIAYQVYLNLADGSGFRASDNFIDLYPGEAPVVAVSTERAYTAAAFGRALRLMSYVDSYDS